MLTGTIFIDRNRATLEGYVEGLLPAQDALQLMGALRRIGNSTFAALCVNQPSGRFWIG